MPAISFTCERTPMREYTASARFTTSPVWVEYFAEQLAGRDPTEIERNWALCYQGARFPIGSSGLAALSAIDVSLWDITGKALDKPVYELLGGRVRDKIRAPW